MSELGLGFFVVVALALVGLVGGCAYGYTFGTDAQKERAELRAQCVGGNDRACNLYEVDYGR